MRTLIAAAAASLVVTACGGPSRVHETATSVPQRDLTLTGGPAAGVQVASKIELASPRQVRARSSRSATPVRVAPEPQIRVAQPAPAAGPVASAPTTPAAAPVATSAPADPTGRELAPGATVTILPASTGSPSVEADNGGGWSEVPAPRGPGVMIGGRGGECGGHRGRGPVSILK